MVFCPEHPKRDDEHPPLSYGRPAGEVKSINIFETVVSKND